MATVLLVDDDYDTLWPLQLALEAMGHHVVLAENGQVALSCTTRVLPDLVVTDWNMPVMDGIELSERLRCFPAFARVPLLLVSGETPPPSARRLYDAILQKPVDPSELARAANLFLSRRIGANRISQLNPLPPTVSRWQAIDPRSWP
ncbi:response regulator [Paraburkholderia sp. C35]|uniref:response regulator n=1 Tax=Paraburkholderia sp. C35 TaxID=2126993 RepID=UPI000D6917BB|nr:response regulator [Paraburkholderia sp. C35]